MPTLSFDPSLSPQDNRGPAILELMWIIAAIATIVVAARFHVRHTYVHQIKIEDWLILSSLVCLAKILFSIRD